MRAIASSAEERQKPGAFARWALGILEVLFIFGVGWLAVRALMEVVIDSRERDASAVQQFMEPQAHEEEHRHPVPAPAKPVPTPSATVTTKGRISSSPGKQLPERAGRPELKTGEQKTK